LPACCLLIACSGVLVTIRILNEMRLDYSPIYAGFAYKTTESLWHWRALLRCNVCSHDDAVLVHPELLVPVRCCGSWAKLCARKLRKLVRRHARVFVQQRCGCAMNVHGCRSSGAALCCALIHQYCSHSRCHSLFLTRWLLPNRVHGMVQDEVQGVTRLRLTLRGEVCTAACKVLCKDARQMHAAVDSGCDENVHQMCELPNCGLCWLQRRSWHCGDARVMDVLSGLMQRWRWTANHTFRFVRRSGPATRLRAASLRVRPRGHLRFARHKATARGSCDLHHRVAGSDALFMARCFSVSWRPRNSESNLSRRNRRYLRRYRRRGSKEF